jgi:uncharacterized protein with GYD domain
MTEYMVLQRLSPSKILDAIEKLRKIAEEENQGIDNYYSMNIFGTWDVGVWFEAKNNSTALDFVHSKLKQVSGVVDSYVLPMFSQNNGMKEYFVLLKLSPSKLINAMEKLRKLPEQGIQGIDTYYLMNIFGTWDVGVWFEAKNNSTALDFVHSKLKQVSGVVDSYVLPMFPNSQLMTTPPVKMEKATKEQEKAVIEVKQ